MNTCVECGKKTDGKYSTKGLFGEVMYLCEEHGKRYDNISEHNKRVRNRLIADGWM